MIKKGINPMKTVIIMRGLPGSGKSTYIDERYDDDALVVSADHHMTVFGEYSFDPKRLIECHAHAQIEFVEFLQEGRSPVIVDNTNSTQAEYLFYEDVAEMFGYEVEIVDLFDGGLTDEELADRNIHGVPVETIAAMRARWEVDDLPPTTFVNLTPHTITVLNEDREVVRTIAPSVHYPIARIGVAAKKVRDVDGVEIFETVYGEDNLPDPRDHVLYVVSLPVRLGRPGRRDLVSPGQLIRDENGQPVGCIGLHT